MTPFTRLDDTDKQHQVAASRRVLLADGLEPSPA